MASKENRMSATDKLNHASNLRRMADALEKDALAEIAEMNALLDLETIKSSVCAAFNITTDALEGDGQTNLLVSARAIYYHIGRKLGKTWKQLAAGVNRHHTTALYHFEPDFKVRYNNFREHQKYFDKVLSQHPIH